MRYLPSDRVQRIHIITEYNTQSILLYFILSLSNKVITAILQSINLPIDHLYGVLFINFILF